MTKDNGQAMRIRTDSTGKVCWSPEPGLLAACVYPCASGAIHARVDSLRALAHERRGHPRLRIRGYSIRDLDAERTRRKRKRNGGRTNKRDTRLKRKCVLYGGRTRKGLVELFARNCGSRELARMLLSYWAALRCLPSGNVVTAGCRIASLSVTPLAPDGEESRERRETPDSIPRLITLPDPIVQRWPSIGI